MLLETVAILLLFLWIYLDFIYPFVIYPLLAWKHGAGTPGALTSFPFGIPITIKLVKGVRSQKLMETVYRTHTSVPYRTFLQHSTFKWNLYTRDPENLKTLLSTKFANFGVNERIDCLEPVFGSGIFTQNGPAWKHSREMLRPQFSREQIRRLDTINEHIDNLIDLIDRSEQPVELSSVFHMLTMDTATEFLFGQSVNSLQFSTENQGSFVVTPTGKKVFAKDFVESYTYLNEVGLKRMMLNAAAFLLHYTHPDLNRHLSRAREFIDYYVNLALTNTEEDKNYIFSHELAKNTRDPIAIRDQMFNILIAGRDTTASTLSFCFYYFAENPQMWEKCRSEVLNAFQNEDITFEGLKHLKYVNMFIKEVLRLHPVVPINTRTVLKDTIFPRGGGRDESEPVFAPKGMSVNYSVYVMHRDPEIYGPDALDFRPERWDQKEARGPMFTWGYLPFNGGPRICLGQQFALSEISLTITRLAMRYESIFKAPGFEKLREKNLLSLSVGNKIMCEMK